MSGHLDDRWHKMVKNPDGSKKKVRSARYEQGLRWRVRYIDPAGRERCKVVREQGTTPRSFLTEIKASLQQDTYRNPALREDHAARLL